MDIGKLIEDLKNPDIMTRMHAAEKLGKSNSIGVLEPLISSLTDSNSEVRYAVVKSLGNFKDKRVLNLLIKSLKDLAWYVRVEAGVILEKVLRDKNQSSILEFLFQNDPHKLSKLYSAFGLIMLTKDSEKKCLKFILSLLNDDDKNVRINAAAILGDIDDYTVVDTLFLSFDDEEDDEVKEAMLYALSNYPIKKVELWLIKNLRNTKSSIRSIIVQVLGNFKSETSVPKLIEMLNDDDSYVRSCAAIALGNIGKDVAIQPLIERLKDPDNDVVYYSKEALGKIGI